MKRFYRIAGKIICYLSLAGVLFGICVLDGVPNENLNLFLLILIALMGGCAAGVYIWSLGERR